MTTDSTTKNIRPAREGDTPFVASVLEMAGRGHLARGPWDLLFPEAETRRRALEYIAGPGPVSWCHRSRFHVLDEGAGAVAALCTFEVGEVGDPSLGESLFGAVAALGWDAERLAQIGPVLDPYVRCFPDMPPGVWIVENVGTRADARRRGHVRVLLEHALEEGRSRGWKRAQISCLIGNDAAHCAYERAGFEVVEERREAAFEELVGSPGFYRMTRAL